MNQVQPLEIVNGTLLLDEAMLRAAKIERQAQIIIRDGAILILPGTDQYNDPVGSTFGIIQLPPDVAAEIAESKELEYEL